MLHLVWAAKKTSVNKHLGPRRPEQVRDGQCVEQHITGRGDEEGDGSPTGSEQEQFGLGGTKMAHRGPSVSASLELVLCSRNHEKHWRVLGRRLM